MSAMTQLPDSNDFRGPEHGAIVLDTDVIETFHLLGQTAARLIATRNVPIDEVNVAVDTAELVLAATNEYHGIDNGHIDTAQLPEIEFCTELPDILLSALANAKQGLCPEDIIAICSGGYLHIHPRSMAILQTTLRNMALAGDIGFHQPTGRWYRREVYNKLSKTPNKRTKSTIPPYPNGSRSKRYA